MAADASALVHRLAAARATVATCESITGGLIAGALTAVPGSSEVVRGGLVTYATDLKTSLAGVDAALIARHGVVSEETAAAMAAGARRVCGADYGVASTGVAGPGAAYGLPVGTIWLSVVGPGVTATRSLAETGDRTANRQRAVDAALDLLCEALSHTT